MSEGGRAKKGGRGSACHSEQRQAEERGKKNGKTRHLLRSTELSWERKMTTKKEKPGKGEGEQVALFSCPMKKLV